MIHVASPFPAEDPKDEMEVIGPAVEGTKNVLEACAKTKGGVKRVVLTSSCAAIYGEKFDRYGYETLPQLLLPIFQTRLKPRALPFLLDQTPRRLLNF